MSRKSLLTDSESVECFKQTSTRKQLYREINSFIRYKKLISDSCNFSNFSLHYRKLHKNKTEDTFFHGQFLLFTYNLKLQFAVAASKRFEGNRQ